MLRSLLRGLYRRVRPEPIPVCDDPTLAVLRAALRADSNTVDVGCNRGSILREMVRLAPSGRHFAFEPIPNLYERLRRNFPAVECHRLALSDEKGVVRFNHFTEMDGFSGLVRRDIGPNPGAVREIEVETARLDDTLPVGVPVALIKIDVEGAEYKVLRGAEATLRRCRPLVIFECGRGGLDLYGQTPDQVFALLTDCGLSIRKLEGWSARQPPLSNQAFVDAFWAGREYMYVASPVEPPAA